MVITKRNFDLKKCGFGAEVNKKGCEAKKRCPILPLKTYPILILFLTKMIQLKISLENVLNEKKKITVSSLTTFTEK